MDMNVYKCKNRFYKMLFFLVEFCFVCVCNGKKNMDDFLLFFLDL